MTQHVGPPSWGRFDCAPVCVLFGPPDSGKTIAARRVAPLDGLTLSPPGATKGDYGVVGAVPAPWQRKTVTDLYALNKLLRRYAEPVARARLWSQGIRWVLVDDISLMADNTMPMIEARLQGSTDGYAKWVVLMKLLMRFRAIVRMELGLGAVITAHERGPDVDDNGIPQLGGPRFPSKGRTSDLAKFAEIVARTGRRAGWRPWPLWDGYFGVGDDPERWFGRDRHGFAPQMGPGNLRVLLKVAGYPMPYPPQMAWMEQVATRAYTLAAAGQDAAAVASAIVPAIMPKLALRPEYQGPEADLLETRLLWAISDGIDEADFRRVRGNRLTALMAGTGQPVVVPGGAIDDTFSGPDDPVTSPSAADSAAADDHDASDTESDD